MKGGEIMKKICLLLILCVAFVFAFDVWWYRGPDDWVLQTGNTARCRKIGTGDNIAVDTTKPVNTITLYNEAKVGQWISYSFTGGTTITHYVRRPGTFAGIGPVLDFESNGLVSVDFNNFNDLTQVGASDIPIYYYLDDAGAISNPGDIDEDDWKDVANLNSMEPIEDNDLTLTLWQKIIVGNMGKPGTYQDADGATITLTLTEQANWIDAAGNFNLP